MKNFYFSESTGKDVLPMDFPIYRSSVSKAIRKSCKENNIRYTLTRVKGKQYYCFITIYFSTASEVSQLFMSAGLILLED